LHSPSPSESSVRSDFETLASPETQGRTKTKTCSLTTLTQPPLPTPQSTPHPIPRPCPHDPPLPPWLQPPTSTQPYEPWSRVSSALSNNEKNATSKSATTGKRKWTFCSSDSTPWGESKTTSHPRATNPSRGTSPPPYLSARVTASKQNGLRSWTMD